VKRRAAPVFFEGFWSISLASPAHALDRPCRSFCDPLSSVNQGQAGPREFRTAPLWGLGQRLFFLHDGRTSDLVAATART
jgi:hypothetical protein